MALQLQVFDAESEKNVQEAIDNLMKDRTVLVIAHRLSTIINADQIIVLDNGKIVESGAHTEILEKDGIYKNLYNIQFNNLKFVSCLLFYLKATIYTTFQTFFRL